MTLIVKDIMIKGMKCVDSSDTIQHTLRTMSDLSVRHLGVVDPSSNVLIGLITDRDIKKFVSPFAWSNAATPKDKATLMVKVERIMTKDIIKAEPEDAVKNIVELMLLKKIGCLPVVSKEGFPVGIITRSNIFKALLSFL